MKVLWFTNVPMPEMSRSSMSGRVGFGGHWMTELLQHFRKQTGFEIGVATAFPDMREDTFEVDGVRYFVIPQPRRFHAFAMRKSDLHKCAHIVSEFLRI